MFISLVLRKYFTVSTLLHDEVTETSGRLHPLRPQNKRLHTPRTTDRLHTRQDR